MVVANRLTNLWKPMRIAAIILSLIFLIACKKNLDNGSVLFCTNSTVINCPFEIEISINDRIIDTLTAESEYLPTNCYCEAGNIGLLLELQPGSHNYSAKEVNCAGTNRINEWSGEINIIVNNCSTIFLDIINNQWYSHPLCKWSLNSRNPVNLLVIVTI